jgi:hypothetical protein
MSNPTALPSVPWTFFRWQNGLATPFTLVLAADLPSYLNTGSIFFGTINPSSPLFIGLTPTSASNLYALQYDMSVQKTLQNAVSCATHSLNDLDPSKPFLLCTYSVGTNKAVNSLDNFSIVISRPGLDVTGWGITPIPNYTVLAGRSEIITVPYSQIVKTDLCLWNAALSVDFGPPPIGLRPPVLADIGALNFFVSSLDGKSTSTLWALHSQDSGGNQNTGSAAEVFAYPTGQDPTTLSTATLIMSGTDNWTWSPLMNDQSITQCTGTACSYFDLGQTTTMGNWTSCADPSNCTAVVPVDLSLDPLYLPAGTFFANANQCKTGCGSAVAPLSVKRYTCACGNCALDPNGDFGDYNLCRTTCMARAEWKKVLLWFAFAVGIVVVIGILIWGIYYFVGRRNRNNT